MIEIKADSRGVLLLGRLGENEHRRAVFGVSDLLAMYPEAAFTLLNRRHGDPDAYPVAEIRVADGKLYWLIGSGDVAHEGDGECQIVAASGGTVIAKSAIYRTRVLPALDGSGDPPEVWESWQEEMVALRDETRGYAEQAAQYALEVTVDNGNLAISRVNGQEG